MGIDLEYNRNRDSKLSLVIPVYQEGSHIRTTITKIENVLISNNIRYGFILVDDGSRDNTWSELKDMARQNNNITAQTRYYP